MVGLLFRIFVPALPKVARELEDKIAVLNDKKRFTVDRVLIVSDSVEKERIAPGIFDRVLSAEDFL